MIAFVRVFVRDRVQLSADAICLNAKQPVLNCIRKRKFLWNTFIRIINSGGQILTYGWSAMVERVLLDCVPHVGVDEMETEQHTSALPFIDHPSHVCVLDSMPVQSGLFQILFACFILIYLR